MDSTCVKSALATINDDGFPIQSHEPDFLYENEHPAPTPAPGTLPGMHAPCACT